MVDTATIVAFFTAYLLELEHNQSLLDRLDSIAGDGDHGATMVMGLREVVASTSQTDRPARVLRAAAEAFSSVGGSIGPLWGTALLRAARSAADDEVVELSGVAVMLSAAVAGLQERGHANLGDKTLLDVMHPAASAAIAAIRDGDSGSEALESGIKAAQIACEATAGIRARRGRARRLAERSLGAADPGAYSACLAWETAGSLAGLTNKRLLQEDRGGSVDRAGDSEADVGGAGRPGRAVTRLASMNRGTTGFKSIGIIGLGVMGRPMGGNLVRAGYETLGYDTNAEALAAFVADGGVAANGSADLASRSDAVITMLPSSEAVSDVVLGPGGVFAGCRSGSLLIDMSTIAPGVALELARAGSERGVAVLDAPVSGGDVGAREGTLSIMVGGEAADFERACPIFDVLGKTIVHVGPNGAGQIVKACNQIVVAITYAAVGEALVLGSKAGIDPSLILDALSGGMAGNRIIEVRRRNFLEHDFTAGGTVDITHKDVAIALKVGHETGVPLLVSGLALQMLQILRAKGQGGLDQSALLTVIESWADHRIGEG